MESVICGMERAVRASRSVAVDSGITQSLDTMADETTTITDHKSQIKKKDTYVHVYSCD